MEIIKISETEGKVITPQPDKEEINNIANIKKEISFSEKDIEKHQADILFHQNRIVELQELLVEFGKAGIVEKDASIEEVK